MIRFTRGGVRRVLAAAVLPAALIFSTQGIASAQGARQKSDSIKNVDRNAEFRFVHNVGYSTLDPHKAPIIANMFTLEPVYDSLIAFGSTEKGETVFVPRLAKSWKISNDGLKVTFNLRDDVVFQDGTPFNAAAVKANIERAKASPAVANLLASVASVDAPNPTTAVFNLTTPDAGLLGSLAGDRAGLMISPAAFNKPDLGTSPVGSGPYRATSVAPGVNVVYERFDDHWDKNAALAKKLTYSLVADANARYNGLRSGEFDGAFMATPTDLQSKELVPQGYHRIISVSPGTTGVLLNNSKPPFNDVRVRQAVDYALDRKAISEATTGGIWPPAYQLFSKGYVGHDATLDKDPYNVKKARKLINEAGANGAEISLLQVNSAPTNLIGETVQQALTDIGLKVTLKPVSGAEIRTVWRRGADNAAAVSIQGNYEPGVTMALSYLAGSDNLAPPPPELVSMVNEAKTFPAGSQERSNAYKKINRYLDEQVIHVPLLQFVTVYVTRPNVVGSENLVLPVGLSFRGVGIKKGR